MKKKPFVDDGECRCVEQRPDNTIYPLRFASNPDGPPTTSEAMRTILDNLDAFVYVADMDTYRLLFANKTIREKFCLPGDITAMTCWEAVQSGCSEQCSFCPLDRLKAAPETPVVWEYRNTSTGRYLRCTERVIELADGKKAHLHYSTDATDTVLAERETRESQRRLELALTASRAGVWEIDFATDTLNYDPICAQIYGLAPDMRSMSVGEMLDHLERITADGDDAGVISDIRARKPYLDNPARLLHIMLPGGERYIRDYGSTVMGENGTAIKVVGMCIDITEYITMEKELIIAKELAERANDAKSQFLSKMSHEIRTPMHAIMGMTDILMGEALDARQRHLLNDINVSSKALLRIINDILDFSKLEAEKLQLIPVDYDFMQLLLHLESMFAFSVASKDIRFYLDVKHKLPPLLRGDEVRVRQVLINVIDNAVKYTRAGGVMVTVRVDDEMICIDVSDTGIGMRSEDLPYIFKDFTRFDPVNNRNIGGTGLGLSITKNLLALMGGSLAVESEYGKGTMVSIRFPIVRGEAVTAPKKAEYADAIEAPEAHVLVVDDNEINIRVAVEMLGLFGISCDTATSGWEAVRKVDARKYDIVFMDHMMPGLDGVETTKYLRDGYNESELVIVALTANAIDGAQQVLLGARMNDYLAKPIERLDLERILSKWLPADKVRKRNARGAADYSGAETDGMVSERLRRISAIGEIDARTGIKYAGGAVAAYEKMLAILASTLSDSADRLVTFLERDDMEAFSIEVHGVKGVLANVGVTRIAGLAENLEVKAKDGNIEFCRNHLPGMVSSMAALRRELMDVFGMENGDAAPLRPAGSRGAIEQELSTACSLLEVFEGDKALVIVGGLCECDHGEETNAVLSKICHLIKTFEYERAVEQINTLL